jgi:two-component system cell cycle response regulator DivK
MPQEREFSVKNILIVEDNPVNQKVMQRLVKFFGHNSKTIEDGHIVLASVRAEKPDLILMDVQLVEVSGADLTREIKDDPNLQSIPVIIVTAFATLDDREKIINNSKCDDFLAKPFLPHELATKISRFFPIKETSLDNNRLPS